MSMCARSSTDGGEADVARAKRTSSRMALVWFAAVLVAGTSACGTTPQGRSASSRFVDTLRDPQLSDRDLLRDLEATILENYLQLSLGNLEAFGDSIAEDRDVTLFGISADDRVLGVNPEDRTRERRPFPEQARPACTIRPLDRANRSGGAVADSGQPVDEPRCASFIAKKLDLHLSLDGSVGWVSDEIDYRVPYKGREASIPLRYTAVLVRDIDRWVLVASHMSYAIPLHDIVALARQGRLKPPLSMATRVSDRGLAGLLRRAVERQLQADGEEASKYADRMARKYSRQAAPADESSTGMARNPATDLAENQIVRTLPAEEGSEGSTYLIPERSLLLLMPAPSHEYAGRAVHTASSLVQLLGPGTEVAISGYRLFAAASRRVAWMAANLDVVVPAIGGASEVTIGMRASFLFALDDTGWNLVQTHVSVPVTQALLGERIFGPEKPPPRRRDPEPVGDPELAHKRESTR